MSKKVQKTLTGAMAAMMATGVVATPAMAATNKEEIDAAYKAAYQATKKAMDATTLEEKQNAINEARVAIKALKALPANLGWATGEFSKQVDKVQHPILKNIIDSIDNAKKYKTQESINIAREAIPTTLNPIYKNSYNSALDKIQQELINNATAAVKKAETDKTKEAIDAAKLLVDDLATAIRPGVKNIASTLNKRLENIFTLKVTNFTLTKTAVTVEFEPTTEILKDVMITVIDNNGNKIAVQKVDRILAGKSKQVFTFERVLADDNFEGIWTVNGVSIDMTEAKLVKDVVNASQYTSKEDSTLIALQEADYISGLLGSYKTLAGSNVKTFIFESIKGKSAEKSYKEAIQKEAAKTGITTAAQIQAIINKVNEELGVSADESDRVELIKEAARSGNATQFVNALDAENIERVNSDWATADKDLGYAYISYRGVVLNANSLKEIQEGINTINLSNINSKLNRLENSDKWFDIDEIVELSELANTYLTVDQKLSDNKTLAQEYYNKIVKEQLAVIDIKESDNTSTLLRTLKALSQVSDDFDYDTYGYDINIDAYKSKLDNMQVSFTAENIAKQIKEANREQIIKGVQNVVNAFVGLSSNEKYTDTQKKTINEALDKLVSLTAKEVNKVNITTGKTEKVNKFDKAIVKLDLEKYQSVVGGDVDSLYNSFKGINDLESGNTLVNAIEEVKSATNANELYKALSNELLGITNIIEANKAEYFRDKDVFEEAAKLKDDVKIENNVKLIKKAVTSVNAKTEMLKATTVDAMSQGLTKLAISEENSYIINLTADKRKDIAEEILNYKNTVYNDGSVDLSTIAKALEITVAETKVSNKLKAVNDAIKLVKVGESKSVVVEDRAELIKALNSVTGIDKVTLDSKIESFITKSTVKNSSGVVTDKVNYTNYTQIRNALK